MPRERTASAAPTPTTSRHEPQAHRGETHAEPAPFEHHRPHPAPPRPGVRGLRRRVEHGAAGRARGARAGRPDPRRRSRAACRSRWRRSPPRPRRRRRGRTTGQAPGVVVGQAGLAAAVAVVAVGVAWAVATAAQGAAGIAAELAQLPAQAGAALLVLGAARRCASPPGARRAPAGCVATSPAPGREPGRRRCSSSRRRPRPPRTPMTPGSPTPCVAGRGAAPLRGRRGHGGRALQPLGRHAEERPHLRPRAGPARPPRTGAQPLGRDAALDPAKNRRLRPRPLVLRANEGECVRVTLTNRLSHRRGPRPARLPARRHPGGRHGRRRRHDRRRPGRASTTTPPWPSAGRSPTTGGSRPRRACSSSRTWPPRPAASTTRGSRGVGLYGALAVEPAGSTWTDPRSGAVLSGVAGNPASTYTAVSGQSGELYVEADIHPPNGRPRSARASSSRRTRSPASGWASTTAPSRW